jgi:hypothetical protein
MLQNNRSFTVRSSSSAAVACNHCFGAHHSFPVGAVATAKQQLMFAQQQLSVYDCYHHADASHDAELYRTV